MNYEEAMNFIQNTSKFGSVLGLDNIKELLERLGNPQDQLKVVHIAGTNGKGSTLAFLAGIFRESGYRAGRYVSPASFCYEERFRINNNQESVNEVIKEKAKEMHCKVTFVNSEGIRVLSESLNGESFSYRSSDGRWYEKIEIPLLGRHQINNAALALEALNTIRNYYCISEFQTEDGLRKTIWRGRIEILEKDPLVICDGAHNPDGAKSLLNFLQNNFTNRRLIYIMGVLSDKDYEQMIQILTPMAAKVYTVAPDNARALSSKDLAECVRKYHHDVEERQRLKECLEEVKQQADKEDVIIICGTLSFQNELK